MILLAIASVYCPVGFLDLGKLVSLHFRLRGHQLALRSWFTAQARNMVDGVGFIHLKWDGTLVENCIFNTLHLDFLSHQCRSLVSVLNVVCLPFVHQLYSSFFVSFVSLGAACLSC